MSNVFVPISISLGRVPKIPNGRHMISPNHWIYVMDGQKHRVNGPAEVDTRTGYKAWFFKGKRHRVDGPAVINTDKTEEYWENGKRIKQLKG